MLIEGELSCRDRQRQRKRDQNHQDSARHGNNLSVHQGINEKKKHDICMYIYLSNGILFNY